RRRSPILAWRVGIRLRSPARGRAAGGEAARDEVPNLVGRDRARERSGVPAGPLRVWQRRAHDEQGRGAATPEQDHEHALPPVLGLEGWTEPRRATADRERSPYALGDREPGRRAPADYVLHPGRARGAGERAVRRGQSDECPR